MGTAAVQCGSGRIAPAGCDESPCRGERLDTSGSSAGPAVAASADSRPEVDGSRGRGVQGGSSTARQGHRCTLVVWRHRGRLQEGVAHSRRDVCDAEYQPSVPRESHVDGVLAERQAVHSPVDPKRRADRHVGGALVEPRAGERRGHQRVLRRRLWQQGDRLGHGYYPGAPFQEDGHAGADACES